ncbi:MAG TPA: hypothetical protein VJ438_05535 [Candidatus Nanoarchaeia archaeon]|nr:hypothetical protein [Candidatus Nanoarchaeia archaeon]
MEKDLKFAILKSSKEIPSKIENWIFEAYEKNKTIFGRTPSKKFKIVICNAEKEWKEESKYYYFPFGTGTVLRDGTFVAKEQKFLKRSDKDYKILLDHEMNHVFFALFYGITKPTWIHEGLANFIGGYPLPKKETLKEIKTKKINHKILQYRYLYRNYPNKKTVRLNYSIWRYFIEFVSDNNSKVIISFMNDFIKRPNKANYNKMFLKYFGENPKSKFQSFVKWLNK